jgi:ABC-2 type transport system ATP-binding protein
MIELRELTKTYDRHTAVDRLSLTVRRGEVFGFIGPNGAGKTTTIRMMGGILAPTAGEALICGISMRTAPVEAKRRIGFIPDRPYLYEKLTGMEFLRFTADIWGVPAARFTAKSAELLEMFALADWANELIESYSHGMKQRLIMAAALVHDPQVLIVDEPMVGLDPAAIRMVKQLFRGLAAGGTTVFMSTHTLAVAEDICDRIGVISAGRLVASGTTAELQRAADTRAADLESVFLRLTDRGALPAAPGGPLQ